MQLAPSNLVLASLFASTLLAAQTPEQPGAAPPSPDDILGNMVVSAGSGRVLPKIGVIPSLSADIEDVTLRSVVRRDLELAGEFEVLPDSKAPEGLYLSDSPVDVKAWSQKGVESVVKVMAKPLGKDTAELRGQAYFVKRGASPVFDKRFEVKKSELRNESHRIADLLIGALTGQNGGFASQMTFISGTGEQRRVYLMDSDGHDAKAISQEGLTALAPAFGKNNEVYFAASKGLGEYQIYTATKGPLALNVPGSVYGLAFSRDRSQLAVSIATDDTIRMYSGPDFAHLTRAADVGLAMQPTFTPSGQLAYVGEGKSSQRVFVGKKGISPEGVMAAAPTFCNNPEGIRAVFMVGVGKDTDLVSTGETGGGLQRLTQHQGRNGYPACSPDGRLVAFFTTRKSDEGSGLYIMRLDGGLPKRVSTLTGDSLRWDPLPPGSAKELPIEPGK